jgi:hypothetical protein
MREAEPQDICNSNSHVSRVLAQGKYHDVCPLCKILQHRGEQLAGRFVIAESKHPFRPENVSVEFRSPRWLWQPSEGPTSCQGFTYC